MLLWPLEDTTCRFCSATVHYGLKEEPSGWTIAIQCCPEDGCGREFRTEWVSLCSVDHTDEVYERAEKIAISVGTQSWDDQ